MTGTTVEAAGSGSETIFVSEVWRDGISLLSTKFYNYDQKTR